MTIFLNRNIINYIAILVGLISFLTTCSSTRFIYTIVDEFIKDEITFFFDLNEEEQVLLSKQVSEMVNWHRTSMLPKYANYFYSVADKLEDEQYDATDINELLSDGRLLVEETVTGLIPYASKFIIKHQNLVDIEFMEKKMLSRRQERIIELSKTEDILYEERLERLESNFERFFGDLTDSQVMLLQAFSRDPQRVKNSFA